MTFNLAFPCPPLHLQQVTEGWLMTQRGAAEAGSTSHHPWFSWACQALGLLPSWEKGRQVLCDDVYEGIKQLSFLKSSDKSGHVSVQRTELEGFLWPLPATSGTLQQQLSCHWDSPVWFLGKQQNTKHRAAEEVQLSASYHRRTTIKALLQEAKASGNKFKQTEKGVNG